MNQRPSNRNWWAYRVPYDDVAMAVIGAFNLALAFLPPGELNAGVGGWCLGIAFQSIVSGIIDEHRRAELEALRATVSLLSREPTP
jgi:hypothetical protein